jgi:hypothetical protein
MVRRANINRLAAQAERISRLKALDAESNSTALLPPPTSGKNKRRSRAKGNSDRARTQRRAIEKDSGGWRYRDPLVHVGNALMDLASLEMDEESYYATLDRNYKHQFADVFADKLPSKLPPKGGPEHSIRLKDENKTTEGRLMRVPTKYYPAMKRFIEENVKAGRLKFHVVRYIHDPQARPRS